MRILIDTNVLISAILNPNSTPYRAYVKAVSFPNRGVLTKQNIEELYRIFKKKFPQKIAELELFLSIALQSLELISIPEKTVSTEQQIRDIDDKPILRAAIHSKIDIIVTGDKDFLEANIIYPTIMTPTEFIFTHSKK